MRILFWGTPEFATPPLRALLGEGHDVIGVVTQPDRPQGRSRSTLVPSPVKAIAEEEGIPVMQPAQPRDPEFLEAVRLLAPDLSVVVAYGHILSRAIIELPTMGTWNIHASLLPRWRGAAPIQAAILAGDSESGVTIMRMVPKLDAGAILLQAPTPVLPDETGGELTERLSELGAMALIEALTLASLGAALTETPQDESLVTYAPKLDRDSARIRWTAPAVEVARAIRAYDPRPGAWTTLRGIDTRISGVTLVPDAAAEPGTVLAVEEHGAVVACASGGVRIGYLQPAGKRRMAALDLAQGRQLNTADVLS
ncbi:MAG: methionyl-tRNA formyltransferase [Gemmatimonadetes bacterium]|nr:methionyl-tRNA formyltransferase [Gemmatimonadota bacterium]